MYFRGMTPIPTSRQKSYNIHSNIPHRLIFELSFQPIEKAYIIELFIIQLD